MYIAKITYVENKGIRAKEIQDNSLASILSKIVILEEFLTWADIKEIHIYKGE